MQIFVPREIQEETRVALTPDTAKKFIKLGLSVAIESGAGKASFFSDESYKNVGVTVIETNNRDEFFQNTDIVLHVLPLDTEFIRKLKPGTWHVSFFDAFKYPEHLEAFKQSRSKVVTLERIPRTSLAQKMDALSSQSSLAGYIAVIKGACNLTKVLPMMATPAGTLHAAKVFVIGAGVAGLQAIATAKRLGARVDAFDTRQEVEEQVKSLGAKFVKIDLGQTGSTQQGYAKTLTTEQLKLQQKLMADTCATADIVITTAKVFGRKAPIVMPKELVSVMKPGSVVVDLAVDAGGNTEGLIPGQTTVTDNGVKILGEFSFERNLSTSASQMLASNLYAFIEHFWDKEAKLLKKDLDEEILKSSLLVSDGEQRY